MKLFSLVNMPVTYQDEFKALTLVKKLTRKTSIQTQEQCLLVLGNVSLECRYECKMLGITIVTPSDAVLLLNLTRSGDGGKTFIGGSDWVQTYAPFFLNIFIKRSSNSFGWEIVHPDDFGITMMDM